MRRRAGTACSSTSRATAARTSSTTSTSPAPSAGSPRCFPSASTPARSTRRQFARGGADAGARAEARQGSSCARCPTAAWATGCCATSTRRPRRAARRGADPADPFNYLGRFAVQDGDAVDAGARRAGAGRRARPGMPMGHALDVDAVVRDGADGPRLGTVFAWPSELFGEADIAALAELWTRGARGTARPRRRSRGAGGHTPSDFPLVTLDQAEVDDFEAAVPGAGRTCCPRPRCRRAATSTRCAGEGADDVYLVQQRIDLAGRSTPARLRARGRTRCWSATPRCARPSASAPTATSCSSSAAGWRCGWREVDLRDAPDAEAAAAALFAEEAGRRVRSRARAAAALHADRARRGAPSPGADAAPHPRRRLVRAGDPARPASRCTRPTTSARRCPR